MPVLAGPIFSLVILSYISTISRYIQHSRYIQPTLCFCAHPFFRKVSYETGGSLTIHFCYVVLYTNFSVFPEG